MLPRKLKTNPTAHVRSVLHSAVQQLAASMRVDTGIEESWALSFEESAQCQADTNAYDPTTQPTIHHPFHFSLQYIYCGVGGRLGDSLREFADE